MRMVLKNEGKGKSPAFARVARAMTGRMGRAELFPALAETFKALGDATRVQIVWALGHGELCVTDLASLLKLSPSGVSHHLRTLRNLQLVRTRREHRTLFYRLDDRHIEHLLAEGVEHVEERIQ